MKRDIFIFIYKKRIPRWHFRRHFVMKKHLIYIKRHFLCIRDVIYLNSEDITGDIIVTRRKSRMRIYHPCFLNLEMHRGLKKGGFRALTRFRGSH